jgi:hypothetical protein
MLGLQRDLNVLVLPEWAEQNWGWHRAIYVEAAEYLEHLGSWKWWKKGEPDFPQANLELVDIWHFGLSWFLNQGAQPADLDLLANTLWRQIVSSTAQCPALPELREVANERRHETVDRLVAAAGARTFDLEAFVHLLLYSGMTFELLYRHYLAKNLLNRFRQENGYKTGLYARIWGTLDDNRHLEEILDQLPIDEWTPARIRSELQARYQSLVLDLRCLK